MKKWEVAAIVIFFALFVIFFFSVKQPWEPEVSKVGETVWIDEVGIRVNSVSVDERLLIDFRDDNRTIVKEKEYEAGAGWKFVILDMFIYVSKDANGSGTFLGGRIEDENGMTYHAYFLEDCPSGTPYLGVHQYKDYINLSPGEGEYISIVYKMPVNAVPEKFHYWVYNSHSRHGEVILKK